ELGGACRPPRTLPAATFPPGPRSGFECRGCDCTGPAPPPADGSLDALPEAAVVGNVPSRPAGSRRGRGPGRLRKGAKGSRSGPWRVAWVVGGAATIGSRAGRGVEWSPPIAELFPRERCRSSADGGSGASWAGGRPAGDSLAVPGS